MRAHRVLLAPAAAACLLVLAACSDPAPDAASAGAASQPPPSSAKVAGNAASEFPTYTDTSREVAEGARLFGYQRCAECHSDAGVMLGAGNGNIDVIATAIRDGRPAAGMPAYGGRLTDAQIWQIAAFVKALDTHPDVEPVQGGVDLTTAN